MDNAEELLIKIEEKYKKEGINISRENLLNLLKDFESWEQDENYSCDSIKELVFEFFYLYEGCSGKSFVELFPIITKDCFQYGDIDVEWPSTAITEFVNSSYCLCCDNNEVNIDIFEGCVDDFIHEAMKDIYACIREYLGKNILNTNNNSLVDWINNVYSWLIEVGYDYPGFVYGEIIECDGEYPASVPKGTPFLQFNDEGCTRNINLLDEENIKELNKFPLGSGKICDSFYLKSLCGVYFNVYCNVKIENKV